MTRRFPLLLRVLAVVLALVQSASPAAAAVADGLLAREGGTRPVVVHVEDRQHEGCPPVHATDCALCAYLSVVAEPGSSGTPFACAAARVPIAAAPSDAPEAARRSLPAARAPPGR
ncbi:MAG: hypothetical protein ACXW0Z_00620 [Gemmatirosa sp.]